MPVPTDPQALAALLFQHGFVAAEEEAGELLARCGGDLGALDVLVARRLTGEPLAWITGTTAFCGLELQVAPGVYVPRWQTEAVAERAAARLPETGVAVDVCTGCGAIAKLLATRRPAARVLACDLDPRAVACARANGVEALEGDLLEPVRAELRGQVDVLVGVVPYVPTGELALLQRDTLTFEPARSYDGGPDGAALLRRVVREGRELLRPGGALVLELGGDQAHGLQDELAAAGFVERVVLLDEEGDPRGLEATRAP